MTDDLVKRLRVGISTSVYQQAWRNEAADRIEALEAALREIDNRLNNPDSWLAQSIDARNIISAALAGEKKDE